MKRDVAQTIFRTVVFAGAMLGSAACHKKPAPTTPTNPSTTQEQPKSSDPTDPNAKPTDPAAEGTDPCAGPGENRPRGTDDDGGGGTGRGFILS